MIKPSLALSLFICLALLQLALPGAMIVKYERTLRYGQPYRFRTAPIDPNDPFRGRYVALRLEANTAPAPDDIALSRGQQVYVTLAEDPDGFATLAAVTLSLPAGDTYFATTVRAVHDKRVYVNLPFERYYTDEHLAPAAERAYWQHSRRQAREAYITVRVKDGMAVLEELYIAGKPLREFLQQQMDQAK